MRLLRGTALAAFSTLTVCDPTWAASLQVAPVMVEVAAPGAATTLKLRNEGTTPVKLAAVFVAEKGKPLTTQVQ